MQEPSITINGHQLGTSQAAALRVAATNMLTEMSSANALGNDEHGRKLTAAYHARLTEIMHLMLRGA